MSAGHSRRLEMFPVSCVSCNISSMNIMICPRLEMFPVPCGSCNISSMNIMICPRLGCCTVFARSNYIEISKQQFSSLVCLNSETREFHLKRKLIIVKRRQFNQNRTKSTKLKSLKLKQNNAKWSRKRKM